MAHGPLVLVLSCCGSNELGWIYTQLTNSSLRSSVSDYIRSANTFICRKFTGKFASPDFFARNIIQSMENFLESAT